MKKLITACAVALSMALLLSGCGTSSKSSVDIEETKDYMESIYGENQEITDGSYDESFAAVCTNGTFVGLEENGVTSYKGIPYAESPTGDLRWKAPVLAQELCR